MRRTKCPVTASSVPSLPAAWKISPLGSRGPQRLEVAGVHLAVDELESGGFQMGDQRRERDLRGVARAREHRLAEEHSTDRDSVEPAGKTTVDPGLDRVRVAQAVQVSIRRDHGFTDP